MAVSRVPESDRYVIENWRRFWAKVRHERSGGLKNAKGMKRQYVPGSEFYGQGTHTPYFARLMRRRRAARKVAHESRRKNR